MITSTVGEQKTQSAPAYPKLMKDEEGMVILFDTDTTGTVLTSNSDYEVGSYERGWNPEVFKDLVGPITLQNSPQ